MLYSIQSFKITRYYDPTVMKLCCLLLHLYVCTQRVIWNALHSPSVNNAFGSFIADFIVLLALLQLFVMSIFIKTMKAFLKIEDEEYLFTLSKHISSIWPFPGSQETTSSGLSWWRAVAASHERGGRWASWFPDRDVGSVSSGYLILTYGLMSLNPLLFFFFFTSGVSLCLTKDFDE